MDKTCYQNDPSFVFHPFLAVHRHSGIYDMFLFALLLITVFTVHIFSALCAVFKVFAIVCIIGQTLPKPFMCVLDVMHKKYTAINCMQMHTIFQPLGCIQAQWCFEQKNLCEHANTMRKLLMLIIFAIFNTLYIAGLNKFLSVLNYNLEQCSCGRKAVVVSGVFLSSVSHTLLH